MSRAGKSFFPYPPSLATNKPLAIAFLIFLIGLMGATLALLFHDGETQAIPTAVATGILVWVLERLSTRRYLALPGESSARSNLAPVLFIIIAAFFLYFPTLHTYFITDDFGCLHAFHHPSLRLFLRMFHTDLAQVVEGETGQEIRPFYAFFFMTGYKLSGLNPLGYHLAAVFLHILNSLLVFRIADGMAPGKPWRAGFAGIFFAVQPAHAWAVAWITGSPAEGIHTLFYLGAFLGFMYFRNTGKAGYLVLSVMAFAACLLSKEIAVTLPLVLVCYDALQRLLENSGASRGDKESHGPPIFNRMRAYLPFGILLVVYFVWRHIVFSHFLGENFWAESLGVQADARGSGLLSLVRQFALVGRNLLSHHASNLRSLLLPSPPLALGIALGVIAAWTLALWHRRSENTRSVEIILYFGVVWYLVTDLPLLVATFEPRHLYLVAVGPCIAIAFLIFPEEVGSLSRPGIIRFVGAAVLIAIFACQLWKDNRQIIERGEMTRKATVQMAATVKNIPARTLVIIPFREHGYLPFALQVPFTSADLYSQVRIIEYPDMCDCPLPRWRDKTLRILEAELAGSADRTVDIELLTWDEHIGALRAVGSQVGRESIRTTVTESLAGPIGMLTSSDEAAASRLVDALVKLASKCK